MTESRLNLQHLKSDVSSLQKDLNAVLEENTELRSGCWSIGNYGNLKQQVLYNIFIPIQPLYLYNTEPYYVILVLVELAPWCPLIL